MPKVIFFGTPDFVVPVLELLAKHVQVVGVVTAPDKPVGRKQILTPSPVTVATRRLGIPVVSTPLPEFDLGVVAAYNKILPSSVLSQARLGFLNIHPSLLPKYRGPSPVRSAILEGKTETGVTIIRLDAEMDHGPIVAQEHWQIPADATAPFCEAELFRIGADLLLRSLDAPGQPQDHTKATYTKKFTREDGRLDFSRPASELLNRIRALADNPGTWTTLLDGTILTILSAHIEHDTLVPDTVQLAGGKPMDWQSFLRGHPDTHLG